MDHPKLYKGLILYYSSDIMSQYGNLMNLRTASVNALAGAFRGKMIQNLETMEVLAVTGAERSSGDGSFYFMALRPDDSPFYDSRRSNIVHVRQPEFHEYQLVDAPIPDWPIFRDLKRREPVHTS